MVNVYLQLVVIECTNVAGFDQMSEERIELTVARQPRIFEVSLLWTRPSIDVHSDVYHSAADDVEECLIRPICPVLGFMCAKPVQTELVCLSLQDC